MRAAEPRIDGRMIGAVRDDPGPPAGAESPNNAGLSSNDRVLIMAYEMELSNRHGDDHRRT
jgi:hypothetical protein